MRVLAILLCGSAVIQSQAQAAPAQQAAPPKAVNLPSSKQLRNTIPGAPQRTNSLPIAMAVSPDKRYLAILNAGYGNVASGYAQSIAILNLETNQLADFPDARLKQRAHQTYFGGLAFSADGTELFASIASLSDPKGEMPNDTGNGIVVYSFADGRLRPSRVIPIEPVRLTEGKKSPKGLFKRLSAGEAAPYPAGFALVPPGRNSILVAGNLSDTAMLLYLQGGSVQQFDLSTGDLVPSAYPLNVTISRDGKRAWVSLWNASAVAELDLGAGKVVRQISLLPPESPADNSSHPTAMLLSPDEKALYVTISNRDKIAVIDAESGRVLRMLNARLADQQFGGAIPLGLAQSDDGKRLFVADAGLDAIAVFDPDAQKLDPLGFIPTEWYPTALASVKGELIVASGKGTGTGPNSGLVPAPKNATSTPPPGSNATLPPRGQAAPVVQHPYIAALIAGSVARIKISETEAQLPTLTREVEESNLMRGRAAALPFPAGKSPIKHAIYIIKENRTYDQIFGDIKEANGDPSLVMYGLDITPNQHKLARQFGVLDNFYDSGEVSGDGHIWSMAAIPSDYLERWYPINYRSSTEHTYDGEGFNSSGVPLLEGVPDVNDPGTGFLWENAARNHITYRDYGEFAAGQWCTAVSDEGYVPPPDPAHCPIKTVKKGEPLPANVGQPHGSPSPYAWSIPVLGGVVPMKAALRDHVDPNYFPWSLDVPDQLRIDEFLNEFDGFVRARKTGSGEELPSLVIMRLGDDHTAGTRAGHPKPQAQVADNDLAVGRLADAVSHSPYWDDTAIFILEDDAQNGADHVDAHRSTALVISKYSPRPGNSPFVDSTFYTTVNMVRTVEAVTGLPPMNNNDARAAVMAPLFSGKGDQPPFVADYGNRDNGLIYQANAPTAPGAAASAKLDFSHADAADADTLNRILWRAAKGTVPMPKPRHTVIPEADDEQ
ncbi:MAG TPA: beta-propeller fold lactonase family protein [Terriglobales bacterium]|nr:beta-propeller fold lactonase family protein [Terriglobales bacterium]